MEELNIFEGDTPAFASEINKNFNILKNEIQQNTASLEDIVSNIGDISIEKANTNGNYTERFKVASPINDYDAVNKTTMDGMLGSVRPFINGLILHDNSTGGSVTIGVTSGSCYDSTNTHLLQSYYSTTITGLTTGDYDIYIVGTDTPNDTSIRYATSGQLPSMDSGGQANYYSYLRKIGSASINTESPNNLGVLSLEYYGVDPNGNNNIEQCIEVISPDYTQALTTFTLDKDGTYPTFTAHSNGWLMNDTGSNLSINGSASGTKNAYAIIGFLCKGDIVYSTSTTASTYHFLPCKGV